MSKFESIYDILSFKSINEAEEDSASNNDDIDVNIDDDFSIDTSLDDEGEAGQSSEDDNNESKDNNDSLNGENNSSVSDPDNTNSSGNNDMDEEEEVKANTDIFSSLTAEEQQIKIKELKNLYTNLYSSCDDILERLNNLDINEDNLETISKISTTLYDIKVYISDYMTLIFPKKSYIENDVVFVRFLSIIKSITEILNDVSKKYNRENEEDNKKN